MANSIPTDPVLEATRGFRWAPVPVRQDGVAIADAQPTPANPDLGAIAGFSGVFRGTGFNTIFRPQNTVTPTPLPIAPDPATNPIDNVLELNLTEETLAFSPALGSIPNRGSGTVQKDVFLNGIPYLQTINDVTDPAHPVGIHFEPGVWLAVPQTDAPAEDPTFVRMASIPHGTTIEAQGAGFTVAGGPQIDPVDITPFRIGQPQSPIKFPSQIASDSATFRLPQDLGSFVAAGTITQAILDDPNSVIRNRAAQQNITSTTVIIIDTQPQAPLFGGGTDNIAFLLGDPAASNPNANAVQMSAIFWIEVVTEKITVPPLSPGQPVIVSGNASAGNPVATFSVRSATATTGTTQLDVVYPQIQYTQKVLLNFARLSWPHVSVATLVPNEPIPVTLQPAP
jgi:hypothetical protein